MITKPPYFGPEAALSTRHLCHVDRSQQYVPVSVSRQPPSPPGSGAAVPVDTFSSFFLFSFFLFSFLLRAWAASPYIHSSHTSAVPGPRAGVQFFVPYKKFLKRLDPGSRPGTGGGSTTPAQGPGTGGGRGSKQPRVPCLPSTGLTKHRACQTPANQPNIGACYRHTSSANLLGKPLR